jgi:poly(3-hydroxybutyrate) depolymerase
MTRRRRGWIIIIALGLIGAASAATAESDTTADRDRAATFYDYAKYAPDATEFSASPFLEAPRYRVIRLTFPSRIQSPSANNDLVRGYYYQPKTEGRLPAVVVLHGWGGVLTGGKSEAVCRSFAERGMAAFFLVLPYHLERHAEGKRSGQGFMSADPRRLVESGRQAVIDLRCVLDWLVARPEVDSQRLGVVGISLGALIANVAMGVDDRLAAGVSILGGGDLAQVFWRNPLTLPWRWKMPRAGLTESRLRESLRPIEPLSFADRNRPRHVLMINGYYDVVIPRSSALELWEALDRPPIIWTNSGHASLFLVWDDVVETAFAFLQGQFGVAPSWTPRTIQVRPIKVALLWDKRQGVRPGLFKELLCSSGRGRLSLDLGLTTEGLFMGASGMVTDTVTVGLGTPIGKRRRNLELYTALQLVL